LSFDKHKIYASFYTIGVPLTKLFSEYMIGIYFFLYDVEHHFNN